MVFRSLWIPLVSAVFNLLSVAAAYGVVVAVFQEGIGASLIGADSGIPIISFLPVMLFAILFGLSMDYNVFLLSRIHEAYNEGDGPRESVIHGMGRIGKVVVFAGLIMSAVFLSFVTADRRDREDVRRRPGPRDPDRRPGRAHGHRTGGGHAARRPRLVAAGVAGPRAAERLAARARGPPDDERRHGKIPTWTREREKAILASEEAPHERRSPSSVLGRLSGPALNRLTTAFRIFTVIPIAILLGAIAGYSGQRRGSGDVDTS